MTARDTELDLVKTRYRARADAFERTVAAVTPGQWANQSPCAEWDARAVVGHVIDMHGVMLRPLDLPLSPAPDLRDDPLGAFRAARAALENVLEQPDLARIDDTSPVGRLTVKQHIDQVASADLVIHRWDLARATGQDDTIDPTEVERMVALWDSVFTTLGEETLRARGVLGSEVDVAADARPQDRLLARLGRDPR